MRADVKIIFLRKASLFADLTPALLARIAEISEEIYCAPGAMVFGQGEAADALYCVLEGEASLLLDSRPVRRFRPGEVFGEMGILTYQKRLGGVRAETDLLLLKLSKEAFDDVFEQESALRTGIVRELGGKIRATNERELALDQEIQRRNKSSES